MKRPNGLMPGVPRQSQLLQVLEDSNALSAQFGLSLSQVNMQMLAEQQAVALRETGRVEFGRGPYEQLIFSLCDSPYVNQTNYADLLAEFCEVFYHFKGESDEQWRDDDLIEAMALLFNGSCQGSVERMTDSLWDSLHPTPEPLENTGEEGENIE